MANVVSIEHAARTALAASASFGIARALRLPNPYWAPVSAMIVMQSSLGAALPISVRRFIGTAIGATVGAAATTSFGMNLWTFTAAIFLVGLLCAAVRIDRNAYRYAGITLAIVMLAAPSPNMWLIAAHRFLEVSLGVAVGLVLSALWPEHRTGTDFPEKIRALIQR